jgi:hypothetical protein
MTGGIFDPLTVSAENISLGCRGLDKMQDQQGVVSNGGELGEVAFDFGWCRESPRADRAFGAQPILRGCNK